MSRAPGDLTPTAGQTVGPFFHYALPWPGDSELVPPGRADAVRLHGLVLDGAGEPVPDALIEIWQADADGPDRPGARARCAATASRSPGSGGRPPTPPATTPSPRSGPDRRRPGAAPFFAVTVFARGLLNRLFTRAYLPGDAEALAATPLLAGLERGPPRDAGRRRGRERAALRHPPPGRGGDRLPHPSATLTAWVTCSGRATSAPATCSRTQRFLQAMVAVEEAWLVGAGRPRASRRPRSPSPTCTGWWTTDDLEWLAQRRPRPAATPRCAARRAARATGSRTRNPDAARWLHRGLTSQDVVDTALMLCARDAVARDPAPSSRGPGRPAGRPGRGAPRDADGGADPDPARRPHHVRPQGRRLADRRPRRVRRPCDALALPGPGRRRGRHPMAATVELAAGLPDPVGAVRSR